MASSDGMAGCCVVGACTRLWGHWLPVTLAWVFCAVATTVLIKHAEHKEMLSAFGSGVVSVLLLLPFVLRQPVAAMRTHLKVLLVIALFTALERNLTNASLSKIGASLKTSLHALNVPLTFVVAAAAGVDQSARRCLCHGECTAKSLLLLPVLALITGGAVVTAVFSKSKRGGASAWSGSMSGIVLQLASGVAYASKYTVTKLVLGDVHGKQEQLLDEAHEAGALPGVVEASEPRAEAGSVAAAPSKVQIGIISQFATGLLSFAFIPIFEKGDAAHLKLPPALDIIKLGVCVTGILVCELRLLELTSPLTVAVLAAFHNVATVLWFVVVDGEDFQTAQQAGFAVSTLGVMLYACLKHQQKQPNFPVGQSGAQAHS